MLDAKWIRNNLDDVVEQLNKRNYPFDRAAFEAMESNRKTLQVKAEQLKNDRNTRSKSIGQAKAKGQNIDTLRAEMNALSEELQTTEQTLEQVQAELEAILWQLPNTIDDSVPLGRSEQDNIELHRWGTPTAFSFVPKDHVDLLQPRGAIETHGLDFEAGARLSGARFNVMRGSVALLHRALAQFMLDLHTEQHGYIEVNGPLLVSDAALRGTGQLPKFAQDSFKIDAERALYLIATSEISLTNLVADTILEAEQLPLKFTSHTPCFRSEAGSYGRDTRGMIRQHQFEKVEMVQITRPDQSEAAHQEMLGHAERVLQRLELPYRVVTLCTGDLGHCASKTYDLEVWIPAQNTYREISSVSNTRCYQARRMMARWRNPETGKPEPVHTLNGSGLAVGRTLVALVENNQQEDGTIRIPNALQPYMKGMKVLDLSIHA